jgi:hypothetical protein
MGASPIHQQYLTNQMNSGTLSWASARRIAFLAATCLLGTSGSLHAQTPNAGEISLTARRAVVLSWPTTAGRTYQLWRSKDLIAWEKHGEEMLGTGQTLSLTYVTEAGDRDYFRATSGSETVTEVVKELVDFREYAGWQKVRSLIGPDPALGGAHGGGTKHRAIFVYPSHAHPVNGQYPAGTIFLKELRDDVNGKPGNIVDALTVMVKRGGTFNPTGGGWEYFMTDTALTETLMRGGADTMCYGCHSAATGSDWVFSTVPPAPTEAVRQLADFRGYEKWKRLQTLVGTDPFLGGAHGGGPLHRGVFVHPADAKPVNGQYPVGTTFLKELREDVNGQPGNLVEALTVMVKRGGTFNPTGSGWEYFMTDTALTETLMRGGADTMCYGCHSAATTRDWVFTKPREGNGVKH